MFQMETKYFRIRIFSLEFRVERISSESFYPGRGEARKNLPKLFLTSKSREQEFRNTSLKNAFKLKMFLYSIEME